MARTASLSSSSTGNRRDRAPGDGATEAEDFEAVVARLTSLDTQGNWVVSCYLKLEPRDRTRGKYLIKLKNRVRNRVTSLSGLGLRRPDREAIARDLERVRARLEDPTRLPSGRGIAIFECEPLGLDVTVPLPQVYRSRLGVDRTPLVRELTAVAEEFGVILCSLYDRTSARFFSVTAFGVEELPSLTPGDVSRSGKFHSTGAGGPGRGMAAAGEHNHHQRIRVEKQRHYAAIAQHLFELTRRSPVRGLVFAGVGVEAGAVSSHLHPYLHALVLGTVRLNPKAASAAEVRDAVLDVRRSAEQAGESLLLSELDDKLGVGLAVNEVEETLRALSLGQVRTLLVNPDSAIPGFRCEGSGRLSVDAGICEGPAVQVEDLIDDALEDALRQRSHVDVIEAPELRERIDGLAALLRFK